MRKFEIFIDGAAKSNPGPAGMGVIVKKDGLVLREISEYIGETTNNVAEYISLLRALAEASILQADTIFVYSDSELLIRQMQGIYKLKAPSLRPLFYLAKSISANFSEVVYKHIPREENKEADSLARKAIKTFLRKE